jgi:hypothetical protein
MPSIYRSKSLTMSFYTGLASKYAQLRKEEESSSKVVKICMEEFEVSAATVSDALLFLKFLRDKNELVYDRYEQKFFSTSTLICIFQAANRSGKTTDEVIDSLFRYYKLQSDKPIKSSSKRGGRFPLSQTDVRKWMKEVIPPIR